MTAGFVVYMSEFARTAKNTTLGWMVDNLDRVMARLRERGATFEDDDQADLKAEGGVASDPAMGKCSQAHQADLDIQAQPGRRSRCGRP
ncbi:MAG: hypothetical protein ACRDG7_11210 [Candidatus Limnocylindria bacterium]